MFRWEPGKGGELGAARSRHPWRAKAVRVNREMAIHQLALWQRLNSQLPGFVAYGAYRQSALLVAVEAVLPHPAFSSGGSARLSAVR